MIHTSFAMVFKRSINISFAQFSWNPLPAFSVSARKMTSARIWRWTLPYLSFLRIAREASCGVSWALQHLHLGMGESGMKTVEGGLVHSIHSGRFATLPLLGSRQPTLPVCRAIKLHPT